MGKVPSAKVEAFSQQPWTMDLICRAIPKSVSESGNGKWPRYERVKARTVYVSDPLHHLVRYRLAASVISDMIEIQDTKFKLQGNCAFSVLTTSHDFRPLPRRFLKRTLPLVRYYHVSPQQCGSPMEENIPMWT